MTIYHIHIYISGKLAIKMGLRHMHLDHLSHMWAYDPMYTFTLPYRIFTEGGAQVLSIIEDATLPNTKTHMLEILNGRIRN